MSRAAAIAARSVPPPTFNRHVFNIGSPSGPEVWSSVRASDRAILIPVVT
jgi:hypothetical protein